MPVRDTSLTNSNPAAPPASADTNYSRPLIIVTTLFFMWGFLTCLNDILIPHLKKTFQLTDVRSSLIQFAFFGGYCLAAIPAGRLHRRNLPVTASP